MEPWYVLVTRHYETGDVNRLYKSANWPGAFECRDRDHALKIIAALEKKECTLAENETSRPTYAAVPHSEKGKYFDRKERQASL